MTRQSLLVVLLVCCCTTVQGRDIFVNNVGGDDRHNGSQPTAQGIGGPVRSIARALRLAQKSDRIIIANTGEPYRESITIQGGHHSGRAPTPFVIVGNGAVLDGTRPVPNRSWEHFDGNVFRFRPPRLRHQLLYLDGKPLARKQADAGATEPPALEPLEWSLFKGHIYFRVEPDRLPQNYELAHTSLQVGITLYEVRHLVVSDLVIQGFQLDGVNAHDGVADALLVGLNCRGNGRSGVSVGGASRVKLESSLLGNNGVAQLRTEGFSKTTLVECDLLDNTAPAIVQDGGQVVRD